MRALGITPLLGVSDPERSLAFYCDVLGFTVSGEHHAGGRLTWAHLARDKAELMITGPISALRDVGASGVLRHVIMYLYVDDVRAFCGECRSRGVDAADPVQRFYGLLESEVRDPDGYTILIGEETGEGWSHPTG